MTAHTNPAAETLTLSVTVKITMTPDQQAGYATDYGLDRGEVREDVTQHLADTILDALGAVPAPLLRDYSSYIVTDPK